MKRKFNRLMFPVVMIYSLIKISFGYIGPGTGLSALWAFLAVAAGLFTTILGLIWYPIKRFLGKKKKSQEPDPVEEEED